MYGSVKSLAWAKYADLLAYRFQNELNKPIYRKWSDECWLSGTTGGRLLKLIACLSPFTFSFFAAGFLHIWESVPAASKPTVPCGCSALHGHL